MARKMGLADLQSHDKIWIVTEGNVHGGIKHTCQHRLHMPTSGHEIFFASKSNYSMIDATRNRPLTSNERCGYSHLCCSSCRHRSRLLLFLRLRRLDKSLHDVLIHCRRQCEGERDTQGYYQPCESQESCRQPEQLRVPM